MNLTNRTLSERRQAQEIAFIDRWKKSGKSNMRDQKSGEWPHFGKGRVVIRKGRAEEASAVQSLSRFQLLVTQRTSALQVSPSSTELAPTHVHGVGDAIQPSHPLLSPSPPALNRCQYQGLGAQEILSLNSELPDSVF